MRDPSRGATDDKAASNDSRATAELDRRSHVGSASPSAPGEPERPLSLAELVALTALLMALSALSIDIMLPALPVIGADFRLADANSAQVVVTAYLVGIGLGQLVYGPLSDRIGRRGALLAGLGLFLCGTMLALLAQSFTAFLAGRALQGFGAAGPRVISVAIVRDLYSGRQMARVMSLAMMTFIIVPVIAPSLGQAVMLFGSWRSTFLVLLAVGCVAAGWVIWRLPETSSAARLVGASRAGVLAAVMAVLSTRVTMAYTLAAGAMFGCLTAYIASAEQVFVGVYGLGDRFPIVFGLVAAVMAPSSFTNARLVERLGMRRVAHSALVGFMVTALLLVLLAARGTPPLPLFGVLLAAAFFQFGLIASNFNAIAMQPLGPIAGTGASVVGFGTTTLGALAGALVGQSFNGSVLPLCLGFAACSVIALGLVLAVEGRSGLFRGE